MCRRIAKGMLADFAAPSACPTQEKAVTRGRLGYLAEVGMGNCIATGGKYACQKRVGRFG